MLVLIFLLICSAVQSTSLSSKACSNIRDIYKGMRLGKGSHVPDKPQKVPEAICTNAVCCSSQMEDSFLRKTKSDYKLISETHFSHLYNTIKHRSQHFKMTIEQYILHSARLSMQDCEFLSAPLATPHSIREKQESVLNLYSNVSTYFTDTYKPKISLKRRLKDFVDQHSTRKVAKPCMDRMVKQLQQSLTTARTVRDALNFGRSLFSTVVINFEPSESCLKALVKQDMCPVCHNLYTIARPCPKLCLNTHKGCLAPLLALSDDLSRWSRMVGTLTASLLEEQSVYEAVAGLDHFVHSILTRKDEALSLCDHPIHDYKDTATVKLEYHLNDLMSEISLFDGVFDSLPHQLCDATVAQPGSEHFCWTGEAMGKYNCRVAQDGLLAANPTQSVTQNPFLRQQATRLREIVAMLYSHANITPTHSTPVVHSDTELCWEEEKIQDNRSDKRNINETLEGDPESVSRQEVHPISSGYFTTPSLLVISVYTLCFI